MSKTNRDLMHYENRNRSDVENRVREQYYTPVHEWMLEHVEDWSEYAISLDRSGYDDLFYYTNSFRFCKQRLPNDKAELDQFINTDPE
jgi:hypothetical protein